MLTRFAVGSGVSMRSGARRRSCGRHSVTVLVRRFAPRLAKLAEQIRAERIYRTPRLDARLPDMTDQYAPSYFAGFFSGEGSFALRPRQARFVIKLRRDDRPLLEAFRRDFGIGSVRDVEAQQPWSPAAVWHVTGARDVLAGIQLFDSAPLLGRKARQYQAWRPGAQAIAEAIVAKTPLDARLVESSREAFGRAGAYRPPAQPVRRESGLPAARAAFVGVLTDWAREVEGPLSGTAYAAVRRDRHPEWPTRNTIAETFGGWYSALDAAGLARRAAGHDAPAARVSGLIGSIAITRSTGRRLRGASAVCCTN
jgi:hypothetical protein